MEIKKEDLKEGIGSYSVYTAVTDRVMKRLSDEYNEKRLQGALESSGDLSQEILSDLEKNTDEDARKWAKEVREKMSDMILEEMFKDMDRYLSVREPRLRAAILPYIEEALAAAMGAGLIPHIWAMASDNGLSDGLYLSDGKWRYDKLQDLSEKDRDAMRKTATEIYALALYLLELRNKGKVGVFLLKAVDFEPFPLGGGEEAIDGMIDEENWEDFPSKEEGDLLFFIPFVVARIDEAIYYSVIYSGDEYLQYISALSLEEDWDKVNGEKYGSYKTVTGRS